MYWLEKWTKLILLDEMKTRMITPIDIHVMCALISFLFLMYSTILLFTFLEIGVIFSEMRHIQGWNFRTRF